MSENTQVENLTKTEARVAKDLYNAYKTLKPLPMSDYEPLVTNDDSAYRVQKKLMELKNQPLGGYKVSLTSKQTQHMFDSDEPLYGAQVKSHFVKSPVHLTSGKQLMSPLAEVELEFRAKEDLSPEDSLDDLMKKTTVAPGVEVPDSRFYDWFPGLSKYLVMSDAAVGGYVVYGDEQDTNTYSYDDLAKVHCKMYHNGKMVAQGTSSEVLGNPMKSLQWLVKKLHTQGMQMKAGQMVSSGTFLLPPHLTKGDWKVTFDSGMHDLHLSVK
ncbi:2-keto-4-pentenoate hydratase [Philodulcilactobacillus myokoensis]|uniref:2-keto-4-pentenoate hydratase n=1 Tax=Philodulcilactobacillus myokoensis TaxID=2929573 RepID=A0A9W6ES60_9LACO|nr:2-keto-4-pentenoate hydratase [Philodulcilactobacillus myokoensis]GLB46207.1 2-keto-4-pentenoate hydratase [Philodulcilactobacillus myokoensis]